MTAEMTETDAFYSFRPKFQTVTTNGISATRPSVHDHMTPFFYKSETTNMYVEARAVRHNRTGVAGQIAAPCSYTNVTTKLNNILNTRTFSKRVK